MTLIYPELELDVDRRQIVIRMMIEFPSLRQDVEMWLTEHHEKELRAVMAGCWDITKVKGEG